MPKNPLRRISISTKTIRIRITMLIISTMGKVKMMKVGMMVGFFFGISDLADSSTR